ncbi:MAG: ABC transporter permease [Bifidobacteriaceae bacterium]|jgi:peptide/nickel transport system permease protein|nr:ABC transporter permease [Bifidobacteriaceae bacterium]
MTANQHVDDCVPDSLDEAAQRWSVERAKELAAKTAPAAPPTSAARRFWRRFRHQKLAIAAAVVLIFLVLLAFFGDAIYPVDPNQQALGDKLLPIGSPKHVLGTDVFGRDVLSRLISGTSISLAAGAIAVSVAVVLGVPLGLIAGLYRGWPDQVLSLVMDALMSFPSLLLAIAIVAARGPGLVNSMVAIGITQVPRLFRLVRSVVLSVREETYVDVSRSIGTSNLRIAITHLVPNMMPPVLVQLTVFMAQAMLGEAALSFLGLGVMPPQASWGAMLSDASRYLSSAPLMIVWPGVCIALTVLALNVLGDGLRDSLGREVRTGR